MHLAPRFRRFAGYSVALGLLAAPVCAQTLYWDTNGTASGATDTTTAAGTWSTAVANWSTSSDGTATTQNWTNGLSALFSAGNNATGTYTVTASGTLSGSGIGFDYGSVTIQGGTLDFTALTGVSGASGIIGSNFAPTGGSVIVETGGTLQLTGATTASTLTIAAGTLQITGSGATLVSNSSFSLSDGRLAIHTGGTFTLSGAASLGTGSTLEIGSGGTAHLASSIYGAGTLLLSGGTLNTTSVASVDAPITLQASTTSTVDVANALTLGQSISGTGTLTKTGAGTLTLSAANHFGQTNVTGGTLVLSPDTTLYGGPISVSAGAQLVGTGVNFTVNRDVTLSGSGTAITTGGYLEFGTSGSTASLTISDGASASASSTIAFGVLGTGSATVTGTNSSLSTTETLYLGYQSTGTLTISSGGTVTAGQLILGQYNGNATVHLNTGGTLRIGGEQGIATSGAATFNLAGGTLQAHNAPLSTYIPLTLAAATTSTIDTNNLGGTLTGTLSGTGGLIKTGSGTLTISAAAFSGPVTVSAGTLLLKGSTGALTVSSGSTFSPGNSAGHVTVGGNLSLLGTTLMELAAAGTRGTAYDAFTVNGDVAFGGTLTVTLLSGYSPTLGSSFNLFDWTGNVTGTFSALNLPSLGPGLGWNTSMLYTQGVVSVSAIPEPGTYAALVGLAALGFVIYRRRATRFDTFRGNHRPEQPITSA